MLQTQGGQKTQPPHAEAFLSPRRVWIAVALLLLIYVALSVTASRTKGISFDEGLQLAMGYNLWINHDYRQEGANGDLIKRWVTLPYLFSRPKFLGREDPVWRQGSGYDIGRRFLFELGNDARALLQQARAMHIVFGVIAGGLVFLFARNLFGPAGGLVSLTLFTFSPHMLAFGGIVSTDLSITLTLFAATWWIWKLLHEITVCRLLGSLLWVGLLVLAKPTALVIIPIAAVLVVVKLWLGGPIVWRWRGESRALVGRRRQIVLIVGLVLLHVLAAWGALWTHYGFRYAASPDPGNPAIRFYQPETKDAIPTAFTSTLAWFRGNRLLPEGFLRGIETVLACDDGLPAYANGQWRIGGWWWFFPYTIWVKTHPALFVLVVLGLAAWVRARWRAKRNVAAATTNAPPWSAGTPLFALFGCYLAIAMTEDLNIGHRHVLPVYPVLYVVAGAVVLIRGRFSHRWLLLPLLLLTWPALDALALWPNYLAYFGPQAGGPSNGYKRLVDSSLDWGMDLPALKKWSDKHNPAGRERLFLAYFGADSPAYHGIRTTRLPGFLPRRQFAPYALGPGYYAISVSLLQGVYTSAFGPWSQAYERMYQRTLRNIQAFEQRVTDPVQQMQAFMRSENIKLTKDYELYDNLRFARLCAWLRHQGRPPDHVDYAIHIWHLDLPALEAALLGPPAELTDHPPVLRPYRFFGVAGP